MSGSIGNTAIKRIRADVREMMTDPSDQYFAAPLEDNMFDWHFTIRGPRDTPFEGGVYHGRILLPADYPFKPPNIILLTPNGRFEVKKKICLSISAYHPEHWQPAWGVRLILEALISFMPTKGEGAIGALDFTADERKALAKESVNWSCPQCGSIKDLIPEEKPRDTAPVESKYASQIAQLHIHNMEAAPDNADSSTSDQTAAPTAVPTAAPSAEGSEKAPDVPAAASSTELPRVQSPASPQPRTTPSPAPTPARAPAPAPAPAPRPQRQGDFIDSVLQGISTALVVALLALLYKKLLQLNGNMIPPE
ncbi:Ubiquitin-conjugating enzyme E2 J1 [Aphanomyces cochlioides]|nr:Ubiquitin-conjugating enzyme E2 J1 [Aphanomyces cochlioides]